MIDDGTLYSALIDAGIPTANHESDLYFPVTHESRLILRRYETCHANATVFKNQVEGGWWYDVPFAYTPYWEARTAK